jgi:hypothetical protein
MYCLNVSLWTFHNLRVLSDENLKQHAMTYRGSEDDNVVLLLGAPRGGAEGPKLRPNPLPVMTYSLNVNVWTLYSC